LPHVATDRLNVATGSFSKKPFVVERSNKLQFSNYISFICDKSKDSVATKVATRTF
jgi:hypothetical protein